MFIQASPNTNRMHTKLHRIESGAYEVAHQGQTLGMLTGHGEAWTLTTGAKVRQFDNFRDARIAALGL